MSIVQLDLQKIEQLLNSATTQRQRKMYQALLDKARSQERLSTDSSRAETTPETKKKTQTLTKTTNSLQQATRKSATTFDSPAIPESKTPVPESTTQLTLLESDAPPFAEGKPPQTSLESSSEVPQQQQPNEEPRIFQALGALIATPYLKDDCATPCTGIANRIKVAIDENEYDLLYTLGFQRQAYRSLLEELFKNGSDQMFLKLYPSATFSGSSQKPILSFSLANFSLNCEKLNDYPKGFVLRGIWQYLPNSDSPVISIYRNRNQLPAFKKLKGSQQFYFAKPHHLPVVWDAPVEPFKFNLRLEKDLQMARYFVEVRAMLKDGLYVVEEMLREPTLDIPKFIKVSKKK